MSSTLQLANLFETPVILDLVPDFERLNAELQGTIAEKRTTEPGVHKSNWSGWQSNSDMLSWGGEAARALAQHFLKLCDNFTALTDPAAFIWSIEMWANVSPPGASNEAHAHPGAAWSSVYYVADGYDGSTDPALGGELVLYDPRMPFVRMLPFDLRYRRPDGRPADSQTSIRPVEGRLVMFPPWLLHAVHPFNGPTDRVSIAMNAVLMPARAPSVPDGQ